MTSVLLTGTSSGVGQAAALQFARAGFQVIATMRDLSKSKTLADNARAEKLNIDIRQLDVTDTQSLQPAIQTILTDYKQIDILINNAGAGLLSTVEQTSATQLQHVMNVNFFGVWYLTQAVLPSMRAARAGRIISLTSVGGVMGQPFNEAYCAAKFAVEGMMESLAPIVKHFGIHISLVEPGPINSEFVTSTLDNSSTLPLTLQADYQTMYDAYLAATQQAFAQFGQTPADIAAILLEIVTAKQPHFRYQTSEISQKTASLKLVDPTGDRVVALAGSRLLPAT